MQLLLESEKETFYKESWIDVPYTPDRDRKIRFDKKELWEPGHEQNYVH